MSEPEKEPGSTAESVGWEQALTETLKAAEAKPAAVASEPDPSNVEPTVEKSEVEPGKVEESHVDPLQPPESWSDETKTYFKTLDKTGQEFLLNRHKGLEGDYTKKTQELADTRKRYERLDSVLNPYEEVAKRGGIDLTPHVAQALQYYMAYQKDPTSTVKQLIQAANLNAQALGLVEEEGVDPTIRALRSEIEPIKREVANLKQGTAQQSEAQLVSQVNAFKEAKDEAGNLKYPHFEKARVLMAPLVGSGKSMEEAYNEVVWAIPEYRQSQEKVLKESAEKEAKAKAEKARLEKVKKAKEAETLPSSDTDKGKSKKQFKGFRGDWEEALKETLSQLQ